MRASLRRSLQELASLHGIQTAYRDVSGRRHAATPEALLATLEAMGTPVLRLEDAPEALRQTCLARMKEAIDPVLVCWEGRPGDIAIRMPAGQPSAVELTLELENGTVQPMVVHPGDWSTESSVAFDGRTFETKRLRLPRALPLGYHRLRLGPGSDGAESMLLVAPRKAYHARDVHPRWWGAFLPLYALHSSSSWGTGDLGDLAVLFRELHALGASLLGTLPLLASFMDRPFDPSPYAPASRLFWNELFICIDRIPELHASSEARLLVGSPEFRAEVERQRRAGQVQYRESMSLKRRVLWILMRQLYSGGGDRLAALQEFVASSPRVEDYAAFRAAGERRGCGWTEWAAPARDGILTDSDYDEEGRRYHLYVQFILHEQLAQLRSAIGSVWPGLYLDLPLGVHTSSYDVWRERESFALAASGGAPPDAVFTRGQDWGFPPLHPQRLRKAHYRYFIDCLRQQLRHAGLLRIDHVMGLHRLFWIPGGMDASQGVYVRYHPEEFYAILCLESHRHRSGIVGENLGTVPAAVGRSLKSHGIRGMYVLQYELAMEEGQAPGPIGSDNLACLNTHDMPPFAGFLRNLDLEDRRALGLLEAEDLPRERSSRQASIRSLSHFLAGKGLLGPSRPSEEEITRAALAWLASSQAEIVLVNLENLWGETEPQNIPGTTDAQRPNWRRKASKSLEEIKREPGLREEMQRIDRLRRSQEGTDDADA